MTAVCAGEIEQRQGSLSVGALTRRPLLRRHPTQTDQRNYHPGHRTSPAAGVAEQAGDRSQAASAVTPRLRLCPRPPAGPARHRHAGQPRCLAGLSRPRLRAHHQAVARPPSRVGLPAGAGVLVRSAPTGGIAARALEVTLLTGLRTSEVIGARWSEIDLEKMVWVIPPDRLKDRRTLDDHRVRYRPKR